MDTDIQFSYCFAPHQIYALLIHLLTVLSHVLQPPDSSQYRSQLLYKIQHQVDLNTVFFSVKTWSISVSPHQEKSKCTQEQLAVFSTLQFYMTNCTTPTPLAEVVTSEISIKIATLSPYQILLCIIHTVTTQLYFQWVIYNYIGYNYMFQPCVLAIIRLSLDLSSNYTISGVFWEVWWDEISSL